VNLKKISDVMNHPHRISSVGLKWSFSCNVRDPARHVRDGHAMCPVRIATLLIDVIGKLWRFYEKIARILVPDASERLIEGAYRLMIEIEEYAVSHAQ